MKHIAKVGILALIALVGGTPVMACMLPSVVLTDQEKACCRRMAHRCGDHSMPSSHSCCKTVGSPDRAAVAKSSFNPAPPLQSVYVTQPAVGPGDLACRADLRPSVPGHSPPESPPSRSDILRI